MTRFLHRSQWLDTLEQHHRFSSVWGKVVRQLQRSAAKSWASIRVQFDMTAADELIDLDDDITHAISQLGTCVDSGELEDVDVGSVVVELAARPAAAVHDPIEAAENARPPQLEDVQLPPLENVQWTDAVQKWFLRQDAKYRGFFIRRLEQLASGERSRILSKRLTGCRHHIYETYLDQATAQRVLWTECRDMGAPSILVWRVSIHKKVSHNMLQIDEALGRLNRQVAKLGSENVESGVMMLDEETVLLDPQSNKPLKIYQLPRTDLSLMDSAEWAPALRMTGMERRIVERRGTVLVLGRSGTGKTICICNRMLRDRQLLGSVTQLFVARSRRVRELVKSLQQQHSTAQQLEHTRFLRFEDLLRECRDIAPEQGALFCRNKRVTFAEFRDVFFPSVRKKFRLDAHAHAHTHVCSHARRHAHKQDRAHARPNMCVHRLDALVAWTQIRSYIKGSVEAAFGNRYLSREEYLGIGESRWRLEHGVMHVYTCVDTRVDTCMRTCRDVH